RSLGHHLARGDFGQSGGPATVGRGASQSAELLIVNELAELVRGAGRTFWVARHLQHTEGKAQRVDEEQATDQRGAQTQDELHGLGRLDRPHQPRQDAEHTGLSATRYQAGRGRFAEQAAIARASGRGEDRGLAFEPEDAAVYVGPLRQHAGVVHEVARGEVVASIDYEIERTHDLERILGRQLRVEPLEHHVRIDIGDPVGRRIELGPSDVAHTVENLTLEIRRVDDVDVDEAERSDA